MSIALQDGQVDVLPFFTDDHCYGIYDDDLTTSDPQSTYSCTPPSSPEGAIYDPFFSSTDGLDPSNGSPMCAAAIQKPNFFATEPLTSEQLSDIANSMTPLGPSLAPVAANNITPVGNNGMTSVATNNAPVVTEIVVKDDPLSTEAMTDEPTELANDDDLYQEEDEEPDLSTRKRSRKRRKINSEESVEISPLSNVPIPDPEEGLMLNREQLLALSSKTFEEYISRLMATRDLTLEEKKEVKRQRRLIKNRESAQASRQRKKSYIEKLEQKVAALSSANAQLREQLNSMQNENRTLTNENKTLKEEVARLQALVSKTPGLNNLIQSGAKLAAASQSGVSKSNANARAAGVCLLVLLLSFGLLFPQLRSNTGMWKDIVVPHVGPRVVQGQDYELASSSRDLSSILEGQEFNTKRLEDQYMQRFQKRVEQPVIPEEPVVEEPRPLEPEPVPEPKKETLTVVDTHVFDEDYLPPRRYSGEAKRKRSEITPSYDSHPEVHIGAAGDDLLNATRLAGVEVPAIQNWKQNTTYLMCSNIQHMTPKESSAINTEPAADPTESFVAFYIPPEPNSTGEEKQFMELTCKIIAVDMVPVLRKMSKPLVPSPSIAV